VISEIPPIKYFFSYLNSKVKSCPSGIRGKPGLYGINPVSYPGISQNSDFSWKKISY
jgi:hypothetical protein